MVGGGGGVWFVVCGVEEEVRGSGRKRLVG